MDDTKEWPEKGLSALLRPAVPGVLVPFSVDEMEILTESGVRPEHIRELVMMGIEGRLTPLFRS